uniref:Uncharacterized protein n=1 Tax=viral metagenome TaxID=1070528 RepID=A0A6M3XY25_9ZZZZ
METSSMELIKLIKEQQAYVKKNLDRAFQNPTEKLWKGDDVNIAFDINDKFTEDNWNDRRISLMRGFFYGWFYDGILNQIVFIGNLEVSHQWHDDQNYVFIRDIGTNDLYYITWCKSRGRTDVILHNGQHISLENFKELLVKMLGTIITP